MSPYREFGDAWERLHRAEAHGKALASEWSRFLEDDPYDTTVSVEDDGTGRIECWTEYDPLPPVFGLELGEMLYQLRAALDSTVYGAAIRDSRQDPPPDEEKLEFPICSSAAQFKNSAWKISPLKEWRREIIETVQPYNASYLPPEMAWANRALGILNDWARIDRHRRLHVAGSWASNANPQLRVPPGTHVIWLAVRGDGFLERDHIVGTFKVVGWEPGMEVQANPNLMVDIALDEMPPPANEDDTMGTRTSEMYKAVRYVISVIEGSFSRDPEEGH